MKRISKNFEGYKSDKINRRKKDLNSIKELKKINIRKARSEIIKYIEENPQDMFATFYYGIILEELKEYDLALDVFKTVADSNANNKYSAMAKIGDMYFVKRNNNEARKYYYKAITESPNLETYSIYKLAKLETLEENYKDALVLLKKLKVLDINARLTMTRVLYMMGNFEEAEKVLYKIHTEKNGEKRRITLEKGLLEKEKGNLKEAKIYLIKLIEDENNKDKVFFQAMNTLMKIEREIGHFKEAENIGLELLNEGKIFNGEIYLSLGEVSLDLGKYQEAINYFDTIMKNDNKNIKKIASYYLGMLSLAKGDFDNSITYLKNSIIIGGKFEINTYSNIVASYIKLKEYDKALEYFNTIKNRFDVHNKTKEKDIMEKLLLSLNNEEINLVDCKSYSTYQIAQYNEQYAINHIVNNHYKYTDKDKSLFAKDIDVTKLFYEIKFQMTEENKVNYDIMDVYEIPYKNCGFSNDGVIIDKIKVIALPNTKKILTMYPDEKKNLTYGEINKKLDNKKQVSKQISRFNERFKKFQENQSSN